MALRTVVLESPKAPPPRKTVVLRAGPPAGGGTRLDLLVGIVGALLLLLCAVLVVALPDEEVIRPQFQLTVLEPGEDFVTQSFTFTTDEQGKRHDFQYEVPFDNVDTIQVTVGFTDDRAASLPDTFIVELRDPTGQPVGNPETLTNPEPLPPPQGQSQYTAQRVERTFSFNLGERPESQIVTGESRKETADEVLARIEPQYHLPTKGTWTLRVVLSQAGDCPAPSASELQRSLACEAEATPDVQQGQTGRVPDPGNQFSVELFSYKGFALDVVPLES